MNSIISILLIFIVIEVFCNDQNAQVNPRNFRCNNGKYIDNRWFCDDDLKDCGDLSDESFGCNKEYCGSAHFKCYSGGPCIEITGRCNTITDCPDGSDELNCGEETHINNCTLHNKKFLCNDKMKCLDHNYACDGICNCFDCSDESNHCSNFDSQSCPNCHHFCLPTPTGPQCVCNSSEYEMSKLCKEIENCTGSSSCSQYCSRYNNITRCSCYENYHEVRDVDGVKCRSDVWLNTVLLYSTTSKIKKLDINGYETPTTHLSEIVRNEINCTSFTAAKDSLYYATYRDNKGSTVKALNHVDGLTYDVIQLDSPIISLAADWITDNLYFTSNKSLFVCSKKGLICAQLKCCVVDYVALAPIFGWMFYTHNIIGNNEQLVMKSDMAGSNENILLDMNFHYPITLTADEWTEMVYLFEIQTELLYSIGFDGQNKQKWRQRLLSEWNFSPRFSVLERQIFFIKNYSNEIFSSENSSFNFSNFYTDYDTNNLKHLYAYNPVMQRNYKKTDLCTSQSCNGLCLLRPASFEKDGLNYTCICENSIPKNNNRWCDHQAKQSVLQSKSIMNNQTLITDLLTDSFSTSTVLKQTSTAATLSSSSSEQSYCGHYSSISFFNIMSGLAFAFSILAVYLIIRNIYTIKRRHKINICEQMEL